MNQDTGSPEICVVMPVFNEAAGLKKTVNELLGVLDQIKKPCQIVLVDDGSQDNTWQEISFLAEKNKQILPIKLTRNFGKESALAAGLQASRGKGVVVMDADLQHPPAVVLSMYHTWKSTGVKVVHAVKKERQREGKIKRISASFFYFLMQVFTGFDLRNHTDFKLLDRTVVDACNALPENRRFFRGLIPWLGFPSASVYFTPPGREKGKSGWSLTGLARMGIGALCSFSSLPMQIVTLLGGLIFLASFVMGIHTLVMKISGQAVEGFATVILLLLFIGSVLMISMGIIGQYISMIYHEVKHRPPYVLEIPPDSTTDACKMNQEKQGDPHGF